MTVDASHKSSGPKTLIKAVRLLNLVMEHPQGIGLAEISRVAGLPKPTVHRMLGVFVDEGLLRVDSGGQYRLATQCLVLGTAFLEGLDLREESRDLLAALLEHTGETCHLGVLDGNRIVYIEKMESSHAVRMHSRVGSTGPVHSTGLGKAMLAHSSPEKIEAIVAEGLTHRTAQTITDGTRFRAELARIRRCGFAVDDIENEDGIRCVAAPVFDHKREAVAGISIAGPTYRVTFDRIPEIAQRVLDAALELSRRIGYPGDLPVDHALTDKERDRG